jgi:hypothetical protein
MDLLLLAARRLFAQRSVSAMMVVTFGLTGGVLVASPVYAAGAQQAVVAGYLDRASPLSEDVIADVTVPTGFNIPAATAQFRSLLGSLPVSRVIFQETSGDIQVRSSSATAIAPVGYRDGVFSEVQLAGGKYPRASDEVLFPQSLATQLGIEPDQLIRLNLLKSTEVRVAGLYSTTGHSDPLVIGRDKLIPPPNQTGSNPPILVTPDGFNAITSGFGQTGSFHLEWDAIPDLTGVTLSRLSDLARAEQLAAANIGSTLGASVSAEIGTLIAGARSVVAQANAPIYLVSIEVALVCLLVLAGVGSLKLRRQSFELAVLKTRGARTRHLILLQSAETALAAIVAFPIALMMGLVLALIARTAHGPIPQQGAVFSIALGGLGILAGSAGLIVGAVAMIVLSIPHVRRGILDERREQSREHRPVWLRFPFEVLPLALGAVALAELRRRGIGATGFSLDPLVLVAPTLLLLGGSLLAVRLIFVGFDRIQRPADRSRSPSVYFALHRLSRSGANVSLALLLVLSAGLFGFAGSLRTTVLTHDRNVALQQLGADWRFLVGTPAQPVAAAAALPAGSTMAFFGSVTDSNDPRLSLGTLVGVDRYTYQSGGWFPSSDSSVPLQTLLPRLASSPLGVALPHGTTTVSVRLTAPNPAPPELDVSEALGYPNGEVRTVALGPLKAGSAAYEARSTGANRLLSIVLIARGLSPVALVRYGPFDVTFSALAFGGSSSSRPGSFASWSGLQTSAETVAASTAGGSIRARFTPSGGGPIGGVAPPDPPMPALVATASGARAPATSAFQTGPAHLEVKQVGEIRGFPQASPGEPVVVVSMQALTERFQQILQPMGGGTFLVLASGASDPSAGVSRAGLQILLGSSAAAIEARLASSPQNLALGMEYSAGVAGALLSVLSLGLALYFGGRRRRFELSSLQALGGRPAHAAVALGLEYGLVLIPSAAIGYALGAVLLSSVLSYVSPPVAGTGVPHLVIDWIGAALAGLAAALTLVGGLLSASEMMRAGSASMALRGEPE